MDKLDCKKRVITFDTAVCDAMYTGGVCAHNVKAIYEDGSWDQFGRLTAPAIIALFQANCPRDLPQHFDKQCY
jgi:hypothetical protein